MLKKIYKLVAKFVFSFLLIYGYNLIISPINMVIPFNIITLSYVTLLGIPAFLSIILIFFIIY